MEGFSLASAALSATSSCHNATFWKALLSDSLAQGVIKALQDGVKRHKVVPPGECEFKKRLLVFHGLLYVLNNSGIRLIILVSCHNHLAAGHLGRAATYDLLSREYWWPKI